MTKKIVFILIFLIICFKSGEINAQVTGGDDNGFDQDSVIIFDSPTPLLTLSEKNKNKNSGFGVDLIFSTSGFGAGMFWRTEINKELLITTDFFISGARKSDELEKFNTITGETFVPNKVNRLFNIPLTAGLTYYPFNDEIINSFKPFISGGAGVSFIIATPYDQGFFSAFGDGMYYTRPAFHLSLGAEYGSKKGSISLFQIKFYSIPFGGKGLESLDEEATGETPLTNFGGVFLDLRIGFTF